MPNKQIKPLVEQKNITMFTQVDLEHQTSKS